MFRGLLVAIAQRSRLSFHLGLGISLMAVTTGSREMSTGSAASFQDLRFTCPLNDTVETGGITSLPLTVTLPVIAQVGTGRGAGQATLAHPLILLFNGFKVCLAV